MYELLNTLLSDRKGDIIFSCFGTWHILYMLIAFGAILLIILMLKNKSADTKHRTIVLTINCAFGLYIADFFLMPFAYGEIDLEKLPFHICTAMCVMCFISRHNSFFARFKTHFALLGFISNLVYVIYPAGLGWYSIHPLSYRVIQTLLFHGIMTAYGLLVLIYDDVQLEWRTCWKELAVISAMTLWALLGNTLYNGTVGGYSHRFNWFFVLQDPFYILPETIAPYIMPFVVTLAFFAAELLVYSVYFGIKKLITSKS